MNFKHTITAITGWFGQCAAAVEHNPSEWVSPRELVNDFIALGFRHRGAEIGALNSDERLKFQIALAKHMTFFADGKLFRTKSKQRSKAVEGRLPSLPEQCYQLSAFGKKLAKSEVRKQRYYIGAIYGINRIKAIFCQ